MDEGGPEARSAGSILTVPTIALGHCRCNQVGRRRRAGPVMCCICSMLVGVGVIHLISRTQGSDRFWNISHACLLEAVALGFNPLWIATYFRLCIIPGGQ